MKWPVELAIGAFAWRIYIRLSHHLTRINLFHFFSSNFCFAIGRHEFNFLKTLQSYFKSICNVAVDPNEGMLEKFKSSVATLNSDDPSSVVCHWFPGPLSRFFDESPLAGRKFNMISAIHSLYQTGYFEATFTRLASVLKDNGILYVLFHTSKLCKNVNIEIVIPVYLILDED